MKPTVIITDHAVLRYLERVLELDVDELRARLAKEIEAAAKIGAKSLTTAGATFVFERSRCSQHIHVTTVLTPKMRAGSNRRREWKSLREREEGIMTQRQIGTIKSC